jgi:hypothetical protein
MKTLNNNSKVGGTNSRMNTDSIPENRHAFSEAQQVETSKKEEIFRRKLENVLKQKMRDYESFGAALIGKEPGQL